jgi:hypothetical protein
MKWLLNLVFSKASAVLAGALWLLVIPYRLWRPVFEKACDWCQERP